MCDDDGFLDIAYVFMVFWIFLLPSTESEGGSECV